MVLNTRVPSHSAATPSTVRPRLAPIRSSGVGSVISRYAPRHREVRAWHRWVMTSTASAPAPRKPSEPLPAPVDPGMDGDLGFFGPGSVSWRVHAEPILALAGLRALYLQSLHPRAMFGVAQNSRYREDPYGRLFRTGVYVATVIYGTTTEAQAAGRRLRAIHARMRATDPRTGETYRIDAPDLLRWVHVTEVESFVTTARRAGLSLSDADVDGYYKEQLAAAT